MDKQKYEQLSKKYSELLEKVSRLKKKKLEIIVKYRKKADEAKLERLRDGDKEATL